MEKSLEIRLAVEEDALYLMRWLCDAEILQWFPMSDEREIADAVRIWMGYVRQKGVLTALWDGIPCGSVVLYLQSYKKLSHQCLFAIIVDKEHRGKGVGTLLLQEAMVLAKERGVELLHLEVYEGNPAKALYERMGFQSFGYHRHFIKEKDRYLGKHLMQRKLV